MNVIFLFGAVQALFFIILILNKHEKHPTDRILIIWILAMGLHVVAFYLLAEQSFENPLGIFILLIPPLIYTGGPLLLIYTLSLTSKKGFFQWHYPLHFIPFMVSLISYIYMYFAMADRDVAFFLTTPSITPWLGMTFYLLNVFLNPIYVVIVLFILNKHAKNIKNEFSYTEQIDLKWLNLFSLGTRLYKHCGLGSSCTYRYGNFRAKLRTGCLYLFSCCFIHFCSGLFRISSRALFINTPKFRMQWQNPGKKQNMKKHRSMILKHKHISDVFKPICKEKPLFGKAN